MNEAGRYDRNKRIRVFVRLFLGIMRDFWREARIARKQGMAPARERMSKRHRRRAIQFRETALQMGGVLIKLGQFFSTRVDVMPPEYIEELAKLQDTVPAVPFSEIRAVIEEEFGRPLEEVYSHFEPQALAAASLAQVHLANLPNGEPVAVKVQRPRIGDLADIDLATFSYLMDGVHRFTKFGRRIDIPMIVEEFVRTVGDELDFLREGSSAERVRESFAANDKVYVPYVVWDYTTTKVLTLEAVSGIKISDYGAMEAAGIDRAKTAQIVIDAYLKQVLEDGFFHADPHPGNLFVNPGPVVTFVDFGMTGEITPDMKDAFKDMVIGVVQKDSAQIIDALKVLRFLRPGAETSSVKKAIDWMMRNYSTLRAGSLTFEQVEDIRDDILKILRDQPLTIPAQFTFLGKTFGATVGVTTGLDPNIDLIEATRPYVANLIQTTAKDWTNILLTEAKNLGRLLLGIPKQVHDTLEALQAGQLRVQVDSREIVEAINKSSRRNVLWNAAIFSGLVLLGGVWFILEGLTPWGYIFITLGFVSFIAAAAPR